jgi:hypothetical protein
VLLATSAIVGLLLLSYSPSSLHGTSSGLAVAPHATPLVHPLTALGWQPINATNPPPGTAAAGFAFDPIDNYTVLFGGCTAGNYWYSTCTPSNATWTYRNGTWAQLHPPTSPPARYYTGLTWDVADGVLVLFGGNGSNGFLNDTWTFVHGNWTQVLPTQSPPVTAAAAMAYDPVSHQVVLYGGESFRTLTNLATESYIGADRSDTWAYSGGAWTNITGANSTNPGPRDSSSLAYDRQDGGLVLFGGFTWLSGGANYADTWLFRLGAGGVANWTLLSPVASPAGRNNGAFAYDPQLDAAVLFGGHDSYSFYNDTWLYNHSASWNWISSSGSNLSSPLAPSVRWGSQLAYDGADNCLILFGGYTGPGGYSTSGYNYYNDTWAFGPCTAGNSTGGGSTRGGSPGGVVPLSAGATVVSTTGTTTVTVTYVVTVSGGKLPYTIQWNFGDGQWGSGIADQPITHAYARAGAFTPLVSVTDGAASVKQFSLPQVVVAPARTTSGHGGAALAVDAIYAGVAAVLALIAATAVSLRVRQRRFQRIASEGEAIVRELSEGESENLN